MFGGVLLLFGFAAWEVTWNRWYIYPWCAFDGCTRTEASVGQL